MKIVLNVAPLTDKLAKWWGDDVYSPSSVPRYEALVSSSVYTRPSLYERSWVWCDVNIGVWCLCKHLSGSYK